MTPIILYATAFQMATISSKNKTLFFPPPASEWFTYQGMHCQYVILSIFAILVDNINALTAFIKY